MRRREFLRATGGAAFACQPASVLVHEHVLVDFVGADQIRPGRYDRDEVFRIALPKLEEVRRLGCRRLLECTPNFLGRDPELLARLSDAASLEIWSNTGLFVRNKVEDALPRDIPKSARVLCDDCIFYPHSDLTSADAPRALAR
jgi:predicted metal-dependent phosphotriesterase family hydrolase